MEAVIGTASVVETTRQSMLQWVNRSIPTALLRRSSTEEHHHEQINVQNCESVPGTDDIAIDSFASVPPPRFRSACEMCKYHYMCHHDTSIR